MITSKQISLQAALQDAGLRELGRPFDPQGNALWLTAIARVLKTNGQEEYVKVVNNGDNKPTVVKDYGSCAAIVKVVALYPIDILERRFRPDLRSPKAVFDFLTKHKYPADKVSALMSKDNKTPEQIAADKEAVNRLVTECAIKNAKAILEEEARCKAIGNIKDDSDDE